MATQEKAAEVQRVEYALSTDQCFRADQLMAFSGLTKRKQFHDNIHDLFAWAVNVVRNGREVVSHNPNTHAVEVVRMPALDAAARKSRPGGTSLG
jgi:hypothetical protein